MGAYQSTQLPALARSADSSLFHNPFPGIPRDFNLLLILLMQCCTSAPKSFSLRVELIHRTKEKPFNSRLFQLSNQVHPCWSAQMLLIVQLHWSKWVLLATSKKTNVFCLLALQSLTNRTKFNCCCHVENKYTQVPTNYSVVVIR